MTIPWSSHKSSCRADGLPNPLRWSTSTSGEGYLLGRPGYIVLPPLKTICWYSCHYINLIRQWWEYTMQTTQIRWQVYKPRRPHSSITWFLKWRTRFGKSQVSWFVLTDIRLSMSISWMQRNTAPANPSPSMSINSCNNATLIEVRTCKKSGFPNLH